MLAGLDATGLDPEAARLLERTLEDFRRSGVDQDDETRARVGAINRRLTEVGLEFSRVIRDDVRTVSVAPDRLAGLPQDWLGDPEFIQDDGDHPTDEGQVRLADDIADALRPVDPQLLG